MFRRIALLLCVSSFIFLGTTIGLVAQQNEAVSAQIKRLEARKTPTPQYQLVSNQMKGKSKDWLRIVATYDTDAQWTDDLTFTYYVLVRNKDPKGPPRSLFRGKVTYVNVGKGRNHESDVYLHPSTIARYGDAEMVAVLIESGGRLLASESQPPSSKRWWEQLSPIDGLVLNRMQTPFAMINFDDFEAVRTIVAPQ